MIDTGRKDSMVGQITSILSQNKTPDLANSLDNREADDNDSSRERGFAGIYHQNIDALDAAKSGIDLPPKDQALPASAISPDGLKSNALSGDITLPASAISTDGLKSKTLKGGTALILGGLEPSQEGLAEYAKAQGIDADLLSLLMSDIPSTPDNFSSIVSNAKAGTDLSMLGSMTQVSANLSPESGAKPGQATSVMDMSNIAHDVESANLLGSMKQASTDIAASLRSMTKVSVSLSPESGAKPGQASSVMDMSNIAHDVESANLLGSMKQASTDIAASLRSMTKVSVSLSPESGAKPGQASSVMDMSNIAHDVESANLLGSMKQASTDIAASLRSMTKVSVSLSTEDGVKKDQPSSFIAPNLRASTVNLDGTFKADTRSTAVQGGLSKLDTSYSSGDSAETLQIRSSLSQSVVSTENMLKNNTLQMIGKPDLSLSNSFATDKGTVSLADALQKATIETGHKIINNENSDVRGKTSQAIVDTKVMFERMQTAVKSDHLVVKLPPIDLLASTSRVLESADVNSWTPSVNLVKTLVAGEQGSALLGQAATAELRSSAASVGVDVETLVSAEKGLLSRQEQYLDLSRRLTDALGQRLTSQIQKGAWQVEFDLHPKSLGRIEIQLEMKNGELEAYFNASKLVTRDLLQESMAKLKDELGEHGIETAYVGLSSGNNAKSDENSTASEDVKDQALVKNGDKQQASIESHKSVSPNDGLDISV
jgi:flagellar hook-length control protein FliK